MTGLVTEALGADLNSNNYMQRGWQLFSACSYKWPSALCIHWNPHLTRPSLPLRPSIALPKEVGLLASKSPPHVRLQNRRDLPATFTLALRYCLGSIIWPVESVQVRQSQTILILITISPKSDINSFHMARNVFAWVLWKCRLKNIYRFHRWDRMPTQFTIT